MATIPQGKGRAMIRTVMAFVMAMMFVVTDMAGAKPALAQMYAEPPVVATTPISAQEGEDDPYFYDMHTSMQVTYWGAVVDSMGEKFSSYAEDLGSLDTPQKIWDFVEDKNLNINAREAQVLCIFLREESDEPPAGVIEQWPSSGWPYCDGILQTMFGGDFIDYIQRNSGDRNRMAVYQYLLSSMGIDANQVEYTINAQHEELTGQAGDADFEDESRDDARECYTPGNNIQRYDVSGCGVLCTVTRIIMGLLNSASMAIVNATAGNPDFQTAVLAALTLYITIYGAMVVLGFVNVALGDAVVRIAKLGVVAMVLSSETVLTLFHMVRCFFIEGTTYLVNSVMQVGLEAVVSLGAGGEVVVGDIYDPRAVNNDLCGASFSDDESARGPLVVLEALLTQVFSAHMFLTLLTLMFSKVYGFILAIFLIFGLFGFVLSLLGAVTIYLTSLIGQYLLLSLLPIFVVFLLFEKTKHLFDGWINQLITYSLTPIFLFAYISLFVVVISAALAQMLDVKICWAKWFTVAWVFDISKWQFFEWTVHQPMVELPFGFFEVLIFVLLVFLMKEFEESVEQVARDIGNSYVYVNKAAREMQGWFRGKASKITSSRVQAAKIGAQKKMSAVRGGIGGHTTQSSSGQKGVSGAGGAKQNVRNMVSRKGPGR